MNTPRLSTIRLKLQELLRVSCFATLAACSPPEDGASNLNMAEVTDNATSSTPSIPATMPFAIFPAQERILAAPEVLARGEAVYQGMCRSCHGQDLRGGDMGGPNLLRSQLVLNDQQGELIGDVIQNGRKNPGMPEMPALPLALEDRVAVAEYIHSIWANQSFQGGPPPGEEVQLNIVVGNQQSGETFFNENCLGCHTLETTISSLASMPTAVDVQNSWVAGRLFGSGDTRVDKLVKIKLSNGQTIQGKLKRQDDFLVSLLTQEGKHRSFSLSAKSNPKVVELSVEDPLLGHRKLLTTLTNENMHDVTAFLISKFE
jgi:cytochrome c oxidase cbb3-type subunit 3